MGWESGEDTCEVCHGGIWDGRVCWRQLMDVEVEIENAGQTKIDATVFIDKLGYT